MPTVLPTGPFVMQGHLSMPVQPGLTKSVIPRLNSAQGRMELDMWRAGRIFSQARMARLPFVLAMVSAKPMGACPAPTPTKAMAVVFSC